jgi:hypothetical protein
MSKKSYTLKERITGLRISAQIIYDNGQARGLSGEALAKTVEPLTTAINDLIRTAVEHDIAGCVMAVQSLENEARAHEADARFLIEKCENAKLYIQKIEQAIWGEMQKKGVARLVDKDFSIILTSDDQGAQSLQFR